MSIVLKPSHSYQVTASHFDILHSRIVHFFVLPHLESSTCERLLLWKCSSVFLLWFWLVPPCRRCPDEGCRRVCHLPGGASAGRHYCPPAMPLHLPQEVGASLKHAVRALHLCCCKDVLGQNQELRAQFLNFSLLWCQGRLKVLLVMDLDKARKPKRGGFILRFIINEILSVLRWTV